MRFLRMLCALTVVLVCSVVAVRKIIPGIRCNRDKAIVNVGTARLERRSTSHQRLVGATKMSEMCRRCLKIYPADYEFHLLLASNEALLGNAEAAEASYHRSLELNERPETYAYLAITQLERGKMEEAKKNLYRGGLFNLSVVEAVADPLRTEIMEAVLARHKTLAEARAARE